VLIRFDVGECVGFYWKLSNVIFCSFIASIISSIECIVVVCGVLLILDEKYICIGLVVWILVTSFFVIVSILLISRSS